MIGSSPRPVPNKTQHSHGTDIHAPGGIRTRNLRKRADVESRLTLQYKTLREYYFLIKPARAPGVCSHLISAFGKNALRTVLCLEREEVTGDWRGLQTEELYNLYCSLNIVEFIREGVRGETCRSEMRTKFL